MIDLLALIVLSLATWRVCRMLCFETGPRRVFARIRAFAGVSDLGKGTNLVSDILSCMACASVWIAIALTVIWVYVDFAHIAIFVLATSGVAVLAQMAVGK
mgnify:CR=1 FL=1